MDRIVKKDIKKEEYLIDEIIKLVKGLDTNSQHDFFNVMVGFSMAQNLNLIGSKATKDEKVKS